MSTLDINDDELFAIDRLQHELQNRYSGRPADLSMMVPMRDEIRTKFAEIGFDVNVSIKSYGGRIVPEVEILGRLGTMAEYVAKETDHERKRYDAIARPSRELKKMTQNTHLLD